MTQFLNFHLTARALSATVPSMNTSTPQNTSQTVEDHVNQFVLEYMLYLRSFWDEYPVAGVTPHNLNGTTTIGLGSDSLPVYVQGPDSRQLSETPLGALLWHLAKQPFVRFTLPTFHRLLSTIYGSPVTETPFNRLLHASTVALDAEDSIDTEGAMFTLAPRVMSFVLSLPVNKNKETAKLLEENFIIPCPVAHGPASNSHFIFWDAMMDLPTATAEQYLRVLNMSQGGSPNPTCLLSLNRRAFESPAHLLVTLRDMNKRAIIQWPTEGERESMDARMEAFEPIFATIEPKQ